MTHWLQFAAETPPEPIWLRTLAIVLPVVGTVTVAVMTGPKILVRIKERRAGNKESDTLSETNPEIAKKVAEVAVGEAVGNPIIRLFIDDLHTRLSLANTEMSKLHGLRAVDAATIARLTQELSYSQERLAEVVRDAHSKNGTTKELRQRLRILRQELEETRAQLRDCYREGDRRDRAAQSENPRT